MTSQDITGMAGSQAESLLRELATWGPTTTVIVHGGCVFEFKGPFPSGEPGEGYYNLEGTYPGFHGHIRLDAIAAIGFQEKLHRGRDSYAFTFTSAGGDTLLKVFLGRDADGEIDKQQLAKFRHIRDTRTVSRG